MASEIPPPFVPSHPAETQANQPVPTAAPSSVRGLLSDVTVADGDVTVDVSGLQRPRVVVSRGREVPL